MVKKTTLKERRRHVRAKRILTIEHRLFKHKGVLVDGSWSVSTTKNMSITGILFASEIPYQSGDILELRVMMSGLDVFRGYGRVVRTEQKKSGAFHSVALVFVEAGSKSLKS